MNDWLEVGSYRSHFLSNFDQPDRTAVGGDAVEPVFAEAGEAHQLFLKTYLAKIPARTSVRSGRTPDVTSCVGTARSCGIDPAAVCSTG